MARGYHHVTRDQRCQIHTLKASGWSMRRIANYIGCHVSTISREIKRNSGRRGYRINQADRKARERRSIASQAAKKMTPDLVKQIKEEIQAKWSPEQIVIRLEEKGISISHETIYKMEALQQEIFWQSRQRLHSRPCGYFGAPRNCGEKITYR